MLNSREAREFAEVYPDGRREPCTVTHELALQFATATAAEFGVGESRTNPFEKERAKRDVQADDSGKAKTKRGAKKDETSGKFEETKA